MTEVFEELSEILKRVRAAKEILGMGGFDCAYLANKELEVVANRLQELAEVCRD